MTDRLLLESTDSQLLDRFAARRDETAFRGLVDRHGPMVLGVCRQVLGDTHDAEDAFQAVFLVLARRAGSLRAPHLLGNWLYGVARRTALKMRERDARRRVHERQVSEMPTTEPVREVDWQECGPMLHAELDRLPEKYRVPIVLCFLEGRTNEDAAGLLGCPTGTLKSRLLRARELLRSRLARRGVALSAAMLALLLGRTTSAVVPPGLADAVVRSALLDSTELRADGAHARVVTLAEEVLREGYSPQTRVTAWLFLAIGLVIGSVLLALLFARQGRWIGGPTAGAAVVTPTATSPGEIAPVPACH